MLKGVLLDIDGTLVDSNDLHAHAWVDALTDVGIPVEFAAVRRCVGMGGDKLLPEVAHIDADSEQGKTASTRRGEIFQERYLPHVIPFPGVRLLLQKMKDAGLILCVASSSEQKEADASLNIAGVHDLIDHMVTGADVEGSKPSPEPIQAALEKTGLAPSEVLMVGDTPYDVEAAQKAGVAAIAFRCGGWHEPDLDAALAVYDGPGDLLARWNSSPFAASSV